MVGNSSVKGLTKTRDATSNDPATVSSSIDSKRTGSAIGLILIASGFIFTGAAFMDPSFGRPPPQWRINKETGYADIVICPRAFFYHDLPADEAHYWVSQLTTESLKTMFEGGEYAYAGWRDVPVWYVGTIEDRGPPMVV